MKKESGCRCVGKIGWVEVRWHGVRRDQITWHEIRCHVRSACFMRFRATVVARRPLSWTATVQQVRANQARTPHGACKFYRWKGPFNSLGQLPPRLCGCYWYARNALIACTCSNMCFFYKYSHIVFQIQNILHFDFQAKLARQASSALTGIPAASRRARARKDRSIGEIPGWNGWKWRMPRSAHASMGF